jgi:hypothetical protein
MGRQPEHDGHKRRTGGPSLLHAIILSHAQVFGVSDVMETEPEIVMT